MKTKCSLLSVSGALLAAFTLNVLAAGPLTPPGSPGNGSNGGPSLTEIKAAIDALQASDGRTRIPAQAATYTISAPGNYVLTGNITVASGHGIDITASNVTLDLNGFTITSTLTPAADAGIRIGSTSQNIRIRNGSITSGGVGATAGPGFTFGIQLYLLQGGTSDNLTFEDLRILGINGPAISKSNIAVNADPSVAVARHVTVNSAVGIQFRGFSSLWGKVIDCDVKADTAISTYQITARLVGQCTASGLGGGINATIGFNNN